jgi:hypothetical protein
VLAAAGVDCDAALFNHLGPELAASFMHKTGEKISKQLQRSSWYVTLLSSPPVQQACGFV